MKNQSCSGVRATTIDELDIVFHKFFDASKRPLGLAFEPYPTDFIISPYAKCGTTWLEQIVHGLRTRGSMEFDEINTVIPWLEVAYDVGWDLVKPQVAEPRVYKSHTSLHVVPKV